MIDDSERRDIAARLMREACAWRETFPESECDFSDAAAMMQDLCVFIGLERDALCSEVFQRLADLIDRPTCRNIGGVGGTNGEYYDFLCSVCGFASGVTDPKYCPNCGAKVVE